MGRKLHKDCPEESLIGGDLSSELFKAEVQSPYLSTTSSFHVAGIDEVGRGALFGPVVAAAVILPPSAIPELLAARVKDSKQLSSYRRSELVEKICAVALDWKVGFASTAEIDRINILQASLLAMKRAILKLKPQPALCLIDGNQAIKDLSLPQQTLVRGDERSLVIASASIVAKVWRDALIVRLASKYPAYDLTMNKGYGTERHKQALQQHGPSRLHRMSFRPCQIELSPHHPITPLDGNIGATGLGASAWSSTQRR